MIRIRIRIRNIYVASSWRNTLQPTIVTELRKLGHHVYDFRHPSPTDNGFRWSDIDLAYESWTPREYRTALDHPLAITGFRFDLEAMQRADTCVLVLPAGRSAHLEAGYFSARTPDKELYILLTDTDTDSPIERSELMYKLATHICIGIPELIEQLSLSHGEVEV